MRKGQRWGEHARGNGYTYVVVVVVDVTKLVTARAVIVLVIVVLGVTVLNPRHVSTVYDRLPTDSRWRGILQAS